MGHPKNRSERRFQRSRVVRNRLKLILALESSEQWGLFKRLSVDVVNSRADTKGSWYKYPGRFHKKKPYDCGRSGCCHCHFSKVYDPKQTRLAEKIEFRKLLSENP